MATLDKEIEIVMLKGETGGTIDRLEKTATVGNVDTYTIYMTDGSTYTFNVTNGTSISTIEKTATVGNVDTYTITLTDGSTTTFQVTNGEVTLEQFRVFESDLEDFCDDFEQQIDVINNDITDLKSDKVEKVTSYNSSTSSITNGGEEIELQVAKENGKNLSFQIYDDDINIYGEDENGDTIVDFSLLDLEGRITTLEGRITALEGKHLYKHDIKLTRVGGGAYSLVFSLYLTRSTSITTMTDLVSYIGNNNDFNANGTWVATNNSIGLVDKAWTSTDTDRINVSYCYINNGDFDTSNGSYNTSTAVISDKVIQVF